MKLLPQIGPRAGVVEAYRALRTSIQFASAERSARCLLFTSAGPREGKSLTAANLAMTLAHMGSRVVLIDGDLRRPSLHHFFRCSQDEGLSNILLGTIEWRNAIRPTEVNNLDLIPCGEIPPNPAELLGSKRLSALFLELPREYDLVLLDSPPILLFTDASVLGSLVDGVFLVVRAGETTFEAIARSKALLKAVNVKIIGAILNGVSRADGIGPSGYRYGRYYADYRADTQAPDENYREWLRRMTRRVFSGKRR